jgi:hypothetical protein
MQDYETKTFARRRYETALDLLRALVMTAAVGGVIVLALIVVAAVISDR